MFLAIQSVGDIWNAVCEELKNSEFDVTKVTNKTTKRKYMAIVTGSIGHNLGKINAPIARDPNNRQKMAIVEGGKEAITHFKVLERFEKNTLVEVKLETGRTHQIRVHLAQIGYPIVGDFVYSNGKNPFGVEGQMLHSKKLEFVHPTSKEKMVLEAPLPKYFQDILNILDKEI